MKSIYFKLISVLCSVFLLAGCIEIEEQIFLKNNGSGKYSAMIKIPQFKEMMELAKSMGEENGGVPENPLDDMQEDFDKQKQKMEKIPGITNFSTLFDTVNFIITVKFDFANVKALNSCLNEFKNNNQEEGNEEIQEPAAEKTFCTFSNKIFTIKESPFVNYDDFPEGDTSGLEMMNEMKYKGIYKFEGSIKTHTNKSYILSKDKKSVQVSSSFPDLIRKKITIGDKITLQ